MIKRYLRLLHCPDRFTCDVVYVDRINGRKVLSYDGADPANTKPEYGAISDEESFYRKGLTIHAMIDEHEQTVSDDDIRARYAIYRVYEDEHDDDQFCVHLVN